MSDSELSDIEDSYYDEDEVMQPSSEDGMQEDGDAYMSDNEGESASLSYRLGLPATRGHAQSVPFQGPR